MHGLAAVCDSSHLPSNKNPEEPVMNLLKRKLPPFKASFCPGKKILYRQSRLSWLQVGFHSFLLQQEEDAFALNQIPTLTLTKQIHVALN